MAGIAVDCRYAEKSFPHRACRSLSVAATSVRKVLLAASRTSTPPCVSNIYACLVRHVLYTILVVVIEIKSVDSQNIAVVTTIMIMTVVIIYFT